MTEAPMTSGAVRKRTNGPRQKQFEVDLALTANSIPQKEPPRVPLCRRLCLVAPSGIGRRDCPEPARSLAGEIFDWQIILGRRVFTEVEANQ